MLKFGTERMAMDTQTIFIDTETISQKELLMEEDENDDIEE